KSSYLGLSCRPQIGKLLLKFLRSRRPGSRWATRSQSGQLRRLRKTAWCSLTTVAKPPLSPFIPTTYENDLKMTLETLDTAPDRVAFIRTPRAGGLCLAYPTETSTLCRSGCRRAFCVRRPAAYGECGAGRRKPCSWRCRRQSSAPAAALRVRPYCAGDGQIRG